MIYDRPNEVHRPGVRILAGILLAAMLVLGFLGYPPKVTAQTVESRDVMGLPALDGTNATGRAAPVPLDVELDGSYPVSVSTTPTLVWRAVPAAAGNQVEFAITTLAETNPKTIWSRAVAVGADRVARAKVPNSVLVQGRTFAWSAKSTVSAAVRTPVHSLTVDVQRSGSQPVFTAGNLSVTEGTGELVYTYKGPAMKALAGPIGWTLVHRPSNTRQPGLPEGWRLVVSGSTGWDAIRLNDDGSVTLSTGTGVSVTYVKRGESQWEPLVGKFNFAGETTLLSQNADGTFSATDGNRAVTVFSKPTANAVGHPTRIWALDSPATQQTWQDGRLRGLTDPVADNSIAVLYGGQDGCSSTLDPGFVKAPDGMLCGTVDSTGNVVMLEYVKSGDRIQVGRIVSGVGSGIYAASQDLGWDDSGRIVEVRSPLAAAAVAAGKVSGLSDQDPRVLMQVAYDAQGRVASLIAPAGLISGSKEPPQRQVRPKKVFSYAPFTVKTEGVETPAGFDMRDWLDPVSLRVLRKVDESRNAMTYEYDANGNPTRVVGVSTGSTAVTEYNRFGRPVEQLGPTKGQLTSPTAPRTTTAYDQDENGRDWTGLGVKYWDNAGFNGAPVGGSTGPQVGGSAVSTLAFNWSANPAGGTGAWAARLNGIYVASADGAYRFETQTSAKLWINGRSCAPSCSADLRKGDSANMQIDVVSPDGAVAGVKVMVTSPDGKQAPASTTQLRPNYGLTTSSTVRENDGTGVRTLVTKMIYDPLTTQLLKTISPSGATITRTYEPFDPSSGKWGRSTSVTDASGKTTRSSYYGADETATDCTGQLVDQSGQVKSVDLPNGQTISQVNGPDGGALTSGDGASSACTSKTDADIAFRSTTTGLGPEVKTYTFPTLAGDPLITADATVTGGSTNIDMTWVDTNGQAWKSVDSHGTTTIKQWDALTGNLTHVIETTKGGEARTTDYTYTAGGQVATVTVNGHRLITNEYAPDGTLLRAKLGNGAEQTFELDANNNSRRATTTFPDGTSLVESMVRSPSGRLLQRTLAGPSGTSTFTYTYNPDGRLIDTKLTGSIPTTETRWQSAYTGPDGLNGNRSSTTTTGKDGTQTTAQYTYGADNRLLSSTDPKVGQVEYDAAGRATKVGGVSLAYDAAGHVLAAVDAKRAYRFSDAGTTTTLTETIGGDTNTLTATTTGESLVLGADERIDAQIVSPAPGLSVVLDQHGAPARWVYDDSLGNATWSSAADRAPTRTQLYSPDGTEVGVVRSRTSTPIGLLLDALGWQSGTGATNLRLSTPISIIGDRAYAPEAGRWLQADPTVGGSMNAYEYAIGDPINMVDPTGNAPWGTIGGIIAAIVIGTAIGTLTFGIGTAAVAGYSVGSLLTQIAVGAVSGLLSGAGGEFVQQGIDSGWAAFDWTKVAIAGGYGAAAGAAFAGLSAAITKVWVPGKNVRFCASSSPDEVRTIGVFKAYARAAEDSKVLGKAASTKRMFTAGSWAKDKRAILDAGRLGIDDVIDAGGAHKYLKLQGKLNVKQRPVTNAAIDEDYVNAILKGRPSGGLPIAAVDDALGASQQKSLKASFQHVSGQPNQPLKQSVKGQITSSDKKSLAKLSDGLRTSQRYSYDLNKKTVSKDIDYFVDENDAAFSQFRQFIIANLK